MDKLNFKDFQLSNTILESLEKLGYDSPSEVQRKVIPLVLKNKDIIVKSQTGSGKTAAFAIPICEKIEIEEKNPQALVLTPTRELALQIKEDFSYIGRLKKINCTAVFGKEPISLQIEKLKQRVHVVTGTPGRILDHIERNTLVLEKIKYLVIDEADEMLSRGFMEQVESVIGSLPKNRTTLLFSATIPEKVLKLCNVYMENPLNIEVQCKSSVKDRITQIYYKIEAPYKFSLLNKIIYTERPDSSMIFCRTKKNVDDLVLQMKAKKYSCGALHGGMFQNERINKIESFKRGEFTFLICTDIAARGIDVENITHIINYDIPVERENYIHRIGRTGRFTSNGTAITFVTPKEYPYLEKIEEHFHITIKEGRIPSLEEVETGKKLFYEKLKSTPKRKEDKSTKLNKDITKIYISAGKKKKIRPGDVAGTISSIPGVNPEDIGIIDVKDNFSYVDILFGKADIVLEGLQHKTIKGKTIRAEKAQK